MPRRQNHRLFHRASAPAPAAAGHRPLLLAVALAAGFSGVPALAQPSGAQAVVGSATLSQQGNRLLVTTTNGAGGYSSINWQSFSVPGGTSTYFAQPTAASTSINRVVGSDPSLIYGTLGSNGRLVLVNPAGITIGAGAVVDTAGFTASALRMTDADALAGRLRFGEAGLGGAVSVQGQVLARGGDIVLIGRNVEVGSGAVVQAQGGDVVLAAGQKVEVTGRGLEGIYLELKAPDDQAVNLGVLKGDSVALFAGRLRHRPADYTIYQSELESLNANITLQADRLISAAGTFDRGGSVHVSAEQVVLRSSAVLDVSHAQGGGEILVGGGWQGKDARVANSLETTVETGAQLKASATLSGNGGTVVAWSDGTTRFGGTVTSRGAGTGHGGQGEVSGKNRLVFRGKADMGADSGEVGSLLLDPTTITIQGGTGDGSDLDIFTTSPLGNISLLDMPADYTIYQSELESLNANITLQADRLISAAGTFDRGELLVASGRNISMEIAGSNAGGIDLRGMALRTQGGGDITLKTKTASQDIHVDSLTTAGGNIKLQAPSSTVALHGTVRTSSGTIELTGTSVQNAGTFDLSSST
ncbi:MAG: filamentous hemagglutinin N-terminal domain-containing protein, partial [Comamonadaceae bacterium]